MEYLLRHRRFLLYMLLGLLGACAVASIALVFDHEHHKYLTVAILDVGQGDAIFIESPSGEQLLIDSGPDNAVLRELPKVMPWFDRTLDGAIETHPDADHITGFVDLLKRYTVGAFIEPGIVKNSKTASTLEKEILDTRVPRYIARRGMVIDLGGGAVLQVLYPDHDVEHMNENMDNDGGVVTKLLFGSTTALFMADVSEKVEDQLIADASSSPLMPQELTADILKVGHHGSKTSSESTFLMQVHPKEALISVGAHNTFHHPTAEALGRLAAVGAEIHRTDQEGTLIFRSDGTHFWQVK